jgi:hypothetical protein
MGPTMTKHAKVRMQQRAIPPLVEQLLDEYGEQQFDGHGGVICYFSKESRRRMEQAMGRDPVRVLERYFDYYKVESSRDGCVITIAPRLCRIRKP